MTLMPDIELLRQLTVMPSGIAVEVDVPAHAVLLYNYRGSRTLSRTQTLVVTMAELEQLISLLEAAKVDIDVHMAQLAERSSPDTVALGTESPFEGEPF